MISIVTNHPVAFLLAWIVHGLVGIFLVASFDWTDKPAVFQPQENVVDAVLINEQAIEAEVATLKKLENEKQQAELKRIKSVENEIKKAQKARERELKKLAKLEAMRKLEDKKKTVAEMARKEAEAATLRAEKDKKAADKARQQAVIEKKIAEEKRQLAQEKKRQTERKAKEAELERLKAQRELERAEKEKRRKALVKQRQAEEDAQRTAMLAEEQVRMSRVRAQEEKGIVAKYKGLIQNKIENNWRKPPNMSGLCTVNVRILPGGLVRSALAESNCGDRVARRSVEAAVEAAEPLPLPKEVSLYPKFKALKLIFKP